RACWWWPRTRPYGTDCRPPDGATLPGSAGPPSPSAMWRSGRRSAPVDEVDATAGQVDASSQMDTAGAGDRLRLTLDVSAVPDNPVGAGQYTMHLASALSRPPDL